MSKRNEQFKHIAKESIKVGDKASKIFYKEKNLIAAKRAISAYNIALRALAKK